ncbi:hypothetical protein H2203_006302 [Taxawa tesnikishii (nom. ined.)]|nr:hypothetical protein H2203_006302 [Dothideales sp. JES 119]
MAFTVEQPTPQGSEPVSTSGSNLFPAHTPPARRTLSKKPSWIGAPAPRRRTASNAMKQNVRVTYSHPGTKPPVYVTSSLSQPQWQPLPMDYISQGDEYEFWKDFEVDQGQYQYKFRLGPGDWWVLDESKPTVEDGAGNRNNLLVVAAPEEPETSEERRDNRPEELVDTHVTDDATAPIQEPEAAEKNLDASADVPESERALFTHEDRIPASSATADDQHEPKSDVEEEGEDLSDGETQPQQAARLHVSDEVEEGEEDEQTRSPLFRHESTFEQHTPARVNIDDGGSGPLFRHESMLPSSAVEDMVDEKLPEDVFTRSSPRSSRSDHRENEDEADFNDPSLEKFPTDEAGILQHLQQVETRRRQSLGHGLDEDGTPLSPTLSAGRKGSSSRGSQGTTLSREISNTSLRSSQSHLGAISESDEEEAESEDSTPPSQSAQSEKVSETPTVPEIVSDSQEQAHVEPEASASKEAVEEKDQVETELKQKVPEAPATSESGALGSSERGPTGAIAGGATAAGAAIAAAASSAKDKATPAEPVTATQQPSADRAPLTPPMTPKTNTSPTDSPAANDGSSDYVSTTSNSLTKQNSASTVTTPAQKQKHAQGGFFAAFLQVLFGMGNWVARLFGGRGRAA